MHHVTTVIVGAGQAGLAMSRCLRELSIDHVVLERGEVASSWRTGKWDSLRLLTPNWQSRLPGFHYQGDDPHGFMDTAEVIEYLNHYAGAIDAPVHHHTEVTSVRMAGDGYEVATTAGRWRSRCVVLASGACSTPHVPAAAQGLPISVCSVTPAQYRNPDQLGDGGVLVVGAGSTGVQLAQELARSGRAVTIAVGEHVRLPRQYRGLDIMWWMEVAGILGERFDEVDDVERVRGLPSFQLVGSDRRTSIELNALRHDGVRVVGKVAGIRDGIVQLSGSLPNTCKLADLKLGRLLDTIDEWATASGLDDEVPPPHRCEPTTVDESPRLQLDLNGGEFETIIWATGYRPDFSWLDVPIIDRKGRVNHDGGVTPAPGLYVIGMPFLRRRKSTLIDGVGDDARDLSAHLAEHLADVRAVDRYPSGSS